MTEPVTQTLYVVFHGLITLVQDKDCFHAFLIEMSGHTMKLGHWLSETPLPKTGAAVLQLTGVNAGSAGLDVDRNLVVHLPEVDLGKVSKDPACYARIDMPRPDKTYSFFTAKANGKLTGQDQPKSQKYSAVQVFEYVVPGESFEAVKVAGANSCVWTDAEYSILADGSKVSVLHIYNEPAGEESPKHAADEFIKSGQLFGVDVGLVGGVPLPYPSDLEIELPPGLLIQELAPLSVRDKPVASIVDSLRTGATAVEGTPIIAGTFCSSLFFILIDILSHLHQLPHP